MKQRTIIWYLIGIWILIVVACSSSVGEKEDPELDHIQISNNVDELNKRVSFINKPLQVGGDKQAEVFDYETKAKGEVAYKSAADAEHTWYFVAEVESPVYQGHKLSATHVEVVDGKAYVSYNKQGNIHLGGVEVFDLSNAAYPKIISQALFDNADVNALTADYDGNEYNRKLWLALSHEKKGAALRQIGLRNGQISENIQDIGLSKYATTGITASANGVVRSGDFLYVTAGKTHGGTFTLDVNSLKGLDVEEYPNAKYVAANGSIPFASCVVSLVTGDTAELKVRQVGSEEPSATIPIGEILHQNVNSTYRGKSTLHFCQRYPEVVFVTMGNGGLKGYDIYTNEELFYSPANMLTKGNTNGVTSDYDYIYMANGADGLTVAKMPEQPGELETVFQWDLDEAPASANYMTTDGEWIFIAKGGEGMKILRKGALGEHQTLFGHDNNGVPHGMEPEKTPVCKELLPNLFANVLPERRNVLIDHPEYFENPTKEILLEKTDNVYVTFLSEGAGYRNTLGYYYYNKDNPPQSVEDLKKVVIFPNASAKGSGGQLEQGNTMRLLGSFEANTVIGFYVISNGWNGRKITDGIYSQYTIPEFNVSNKQQSILFYDQGCSSIVMAFEDIALPQGDKDYNDAIFMISTDDPSSIDVTAFIQK